MKSKRGQHKLSPEHVKEVSQLGDIAEGRRGVLRYDDIEWAKLSQNLVKWPAFVSTKTNSKGFLEHKWY
jgi:hypothetical protein